MPARPEPLTSYLQVRQEYLTPPLATRTLRLREVLEAAGRLSTDRNDLRLFGMPTVAWYALGVRIVGRTVIEATRDPQARFLARAVATTLRQDGYEIVTVIDPFVGSGNVLYHFLKETQARRGIGIELDSEIARLTQRNFAAMRRSMRLRGAEIEIHGGDWSSCRDFLGDEASVVFISPPWGDAFDADGLDLRATEPPIATILTELARSEGRGAVFAAIATFPTMVADSVAEIVSAYRSFTPVRSDDPNIATRVDYLLLQVR